MAWRSVFISKPARLGIKHQQMQISQEQGLVVDIPIEDISVLILETPQATITTALLAALSENGCAVITCGSTHHPNGVLLPYLPHSRQSRVLKKQIALTEPQKKRAWQIIIRQKLINQAHVLRECQSKGEQIVLRLARNVRSGDPDNYEGQAAQCYFTGLFGPRFSRKDMLWINSALNYGYAIVRAALARSLAVYGLIPSLGLFHRSEQNAFNLADDLIEPFRPHVDRTVLLIFNTTFTSPPPDQTEDALTPQQKAKLVNILNEDILMPLGQMTILAAIDKCALSAGQMVEHCNYKKLDVPALLPCFYEQP